jgi:hypothetical protein
MQNLIVNNEFEEESIVAHSDIVSFEYGYYNRFLPNNRGVLLGQFQVFFCLNPLLFASCTDTFSKWRKITRGMKRSAQ